MMFDTPFGDISRESFALTSSHAGTRTDTTVVELMQYSITLKSFIVRYRNNKEWSYHVDEDKLQLITPEKDPEYFI